MRYQIYIHVLMALNYFCTVVATETNGSVLCGQGSMWWRAASDFYVGWGLFRGMSVIHKPRSASHLFFLQKVVKFSFDLWFSEKQGFLFFYFVCHINTNRHKSKELKFYSYLLLIINQIQLTLKLVDISHSPFWIWIRQFNLEDQNH